MMFRIRQDQNGRIYSYINIVKCPLLCHLIHNIIKQCAFVHVGRENLNMQCSNLVQGGARRLTLGLNLH